MADSYEIPSDDERIKVNLEDDVRVFLMRQLLWNRMPKELQQLFQDSGADVKRLRRPTYLAISTSDDEVPLEASLTKCNIGAEGVMAHSDDPCVHLAFKCGNSQHHYRYSTFGIDTVVALAQAAEAAWPGVVSRVILAQALEARGLTMPSRSLDHDDDEEAEDDEVDLGESDERDEDEYEPLI